METTPLQIKTDSVTGSGDLIDVNFANADANAAGGVMIYFNDQIEYKLKHCTESKNILTNVPTDKNKEWTIYRTQDSVKIECNGFEVLDFKMSACANSHYVYETDIALVNFPVTDTASDFYRAKGN